MASSARTLALEALERWRSHHRFADKIIQKLPGETDIPGEDRAFAIDVFTAYSENLASLISGSIGFALIHSMQIRATSCDLASINFSSQESRNMPRLMKR
jgi:hypothetical protein